MGTPRATKAKNLRYIFLAFLIFGVAIGIFYGGVIFQKIQSEGFSKLIKEQGINVFFGIIGGLITSGILWLSKLAIENMKLPDKYGDRLTGFWDEAYKPDEFVEQRQEQLLFFDIKHKGEKIQGTLTCTANPKCTYLSQEEMERVRVFSFQGSKIGSYVSISAILDSPDTIGHTVYLLAMDLDMNVLSGISIYFDIVEGKLTTSRSKLRKRGSPAAPLVDMNCNEPLF